MNRRPRPTSSSAPPPCRRRGQAAALALRVPALLAAAWLVAAPLAAQDEPAPPAAPLPSGSATLFLPGGATGAVGFTLAPDGPRFALAPIAGALGVEMRTGPQGQGHTLIFPEKRIVIGPDRALMVVAGSDGGRDEIVQLSQLPIRDAGGLKVPLDFLDRSFGEQLSLQFVWNAERLELTVSRRELRELTGSVQVVHQFGFSTVEIRFSERPRYRVERLPGALEIRLLGDRLEVPPVRREGDDPLVEEIAVHPDRLRIVLAPNAAATEPRLLLSPTVSLIVEVFQQTAPPPEPVAAPRRDSEEPGGGVRTIVLDPGHGGDETGAIGPSGTAEEELTLRVARALKLQLERRLPVRVVLTRNGDVNLPLDSRPAIANQNKADLFISLHFNSSYGAQAHGAETYFLSREASDQLAARAAESENASPGGGAAADPELDLQLILWDLAQSYHLAESQRFATLVQEELNLTLGLRDRGVKQAPFRVLMGAMMPAVLVELGFLSNPAEEARLQSSTYLTELVDSLVRAVIRFKAQVEGTEAADGAGEELP